MIANIHTSRGTSTTIESDDPAVGMLDMMEAAEALHRPITWVAIRHHAVHGTYRHNGVTERVVVINTKEADAATATDALTWLTA